MHKDRHANIILVHTETPPLKVGVVIVKTGIHTLDRPENTALF